MPAKTTIKTIDGYLAALPAERRDAIAVVRDAINAKLPAGYRETMQWGMISWAVPESVLPASSTYNKQPLCLVSLGAQKSYMVVHMMGLYMEPSERAWFDRAYKASGKKLDMGMGCVRFKSLDKLAVDVVAEAIARMPVDRYVARYHEVRATTKAGKTRALSATAGARATAKAKAPAAKASAKKPAAKAKKRAAKATARTSGRRSA